MSKNFDFGYRSYYSHTLRDLVSSVSETFTLEIFFTHVMMYINKSPLIKAMMGLLL